MMYRTILLVALLTITPALATLDERNVNEPLELDIRSEMDEDAIAARGLFGLARKAIKIGLKLASGASQHKRKRDLDGESEIEVLKRDLEWVGDLLERDFEADTELYERDFEPEEELLERDVGSEIELLERDWEVEPELLERNFLDIDELD